MDENKAKSEARVEDTTRLLIEAAASTAVDGLALGCRSAQIKMDSDHRVIWLNLYINDSSGSAIRFVAETNDADTLVGLPPSFRFGTFFCEQLKAAISQYLCRELVFSRSVRATVYRYSSAGGDLPELSGSSATGAILRERIEPAARWEPIGPCGFGC